jgi:hypothetical protein
MNTVEEQLRAAGRAVTEQVTRLPELELAPERAGRRPRWTRTGRRWTTWGAPLAAMAVVVAVAVSLVAVRATGTGGTAQPGANAAPPSAAGTPPAAAQVPRYYIAASLNTKAIVGDLRTGKQVATISPPSGHVFGDVVGAADGSAFVADMPAKPGTSADGGQFFLYRPATPGGPPVLRSPLNLNPSPNGAAILGLAVSPDGSRLAVYSMLSYEEVLRVYSVTTGQVQRQWTMPSPSQVGSGPGANSHMLTWTDNGQAVAFRRDIGLAGGEFGVSVYILDVSRPGHDLRADSRVVSVQSNDNGCKSMLVTPDGKTIVCGVESWGGASASCPVVRPGVAEYSAATGKLLRVLYDYEGTCTWGMVHLYWSSQSGTAVVANLIIGTRPGSQPVIVTDLIGARGYTSLPVRQPAALFQMMNDLAPVVF